MAVTQRDILFRYVKFESLRPVKGVGKQYIDSTKLIAKSKFGIVEESVEAAHRLRPFECRRVEHSRNALLFGQGEQVFAFTPKGLLEFGKDKTRQLVIAREFAHGSRNKLRLWREPRNVINDCNAFGQHLVAVD